MSAASTSTQSQVRKPSTRGVLCRVFLNALIDAVGNRPDVNVGAAGRDDHDVGESGFAVQVDGDDILGFGIIETRQDSPHECAGIGFK